jgi:DNA-binding winged helix-turn-helix (wHTH) protein/Tol biopolymer transport system component
MNKRANELYEFGPFRLDPREHLLTRNGQPLALTPKAFETLVVLLQNRGHLMLKDELMKAVWPDSFVEEVNLSQNISLLRKVLGDSAQGSQYIVTVPGKGYRFIGGVQAGGQYDEAADELIVATHSRTRITVTPSSRDAIATEPERFQAQPVRVLPRPSQHRFRIAAFVLVGAVLGGLAARALLRPPPMPRVIRSVQLTHIGRVEPFNRVLTDGPRIFFTERMGGTWNLAQITESGSEPAIIPVSVPSIALYDIDRLRSRLLVAEQLPADTQQDLLWWVPSTGGSGQRLGELTSGYGAVSPDGSRLVFGHASVLMVSGIGGDSSRQVFSGAGAILNPRWSPDGQTISFSIQERPSGILSLWEVDADGRNPHAIQLGWKAPLAKWNEGECCADWSPDGKYFVFRSRRDMVNSYWCLRRDAGWLGRGKRLTQLYTSPDWLSPVTFSVDGKKIFFVDYHERRELVRYDSGQNLFVPYLGGIPARHVNFSRDEQWVAYKNEVDGTLWRSRADGTEALQLTFPPLEVMHPSWSPDGKKIVFASGDGLFTISAEGGNPERLVQGGQPSWSPDGHAILFTRWNMNGGVLRPTIYFLRLDSRTVTALPGSEDFEGPRWSPDGRYAAASDKRDQKLMLFDFQRQQWSELADGLPYGWGIRWSPDSAYVYYQHIYSGEEQPIFRVRVSDHKVEQVTSKRQMLRADVLSYSLTGLTPDGSPVASLVRSNSDIYALELDLP